MSGQAYSNNPRAWGVCDRCGLRFYLRQLAKEWTGSKVCASCFEPKHPQLTPRITSDAQALKEPRPEENSAGGVSAALFSASGNFTANFATPYVPPGGTMFGSSTAST